MRRITPLTFALCPVAVDDAAVEPVVPVAVVVCSTVVEPSGWVVVVVVVVSPVQTFVIAMTAIAATKLIRFIVITLIDSVPDGEEVK